MKKYFEKVDHTIVFPQSSHTYSCADFKSSEVSIHPVRKKAAATILNATANAMSGSMGNGNELVEIIVAVHFINGEKEEIMITDTPVVRFSLDYHSLIEKAREVEKRIKAKCINH